MKCEEAKACSIVWLAIAKACSIVWLAIAA